MRGVEHTCSAEVRLIQIDTAAELADLLNRRVVYVAGETETHYRLEVRRSAEVYMVERKLWDDGVAAGLIRLVAKLVETDPA